MKPIFAHRRRRAGAIGGITARCSRRAPDVTLVCNIRMSPLYPAGPACDGVQVI
jgi:hypothetical protein